VGVLFDFVVVHVMSGVSFEEGTLADEQINPFGVGKAKVGPGGVPRIEDPLPFAGDLEPQGNLVDLVRDAEGKDLNAIEPFSPLGLEESDFRRGKSLWRRAVSEHEERELHDPLSRPRGSRQMKGFLASAVMKVLQQEEGEAAAMIPMEVAQDDGV
jgi:hypothetical protein